MMTLADIGRLARTVDEQRRSPVADAVAARWAHPPGAARWRRSSASHVFFLAEESAGRPRSYLRFVPAAWRTHEEFAVVADLMRRLAGRGVALAAPLPSAEGELVKTVETDIGPMQAMCVAAAPGRQLDVDALTLFQARAWGAALARVHERAAGLGDALPEAFTELDRAAELFADDPPLATAVRRLVDRLASLPRDPSRYGVTHGDFELDNLAWAGDTATSFDFDDAARCWFVADVAAATRDLTGATDHERTARFDAFLAGYRQGRPLPEPDLALLPLFSTAHAVARLVRLHPVLYAEDETPEPLRELRTKLVRAAADTRRAVLDTTL